MFFVPNLRSAGANSTTHAHVSAAADLKLRPTKYTNIFFVGNRTTKPAEAGLVIGMCVLKIWNL